MEGLSLSASLIVWGQMDTLRVTCRERERVYCGWSLSEGIDALGGGRGAERKKQDEEEGNG